MTLLLPRVAPGIRLTKLPWKLRRWWVNTSVVLWRWDYYPSLNCCFNWTLLVERTPVVSRPYWHFVCHIIKFWLNTIRASVLKRQEDGSNIQKCVWKLYGDATRASRHLKTHVTQLLVQPLVSANTKEHIKGEHYWSFVMVNHCWSMDSPHKG